MRHHLANPILTERRQQIWKKVGAMVRDRRKALQMSQTQLAEDAGLAGHSHISNLENGNYGMTIGSLLEVADALGCELVIELKPIPD